MKYCVIKDTTKVIDGSDNPIEVMQQNALNCGIAEFDILTEEEYQSKKVLEPVPPQPITDSERISSTEEAINTIMMMLM